MAKSDFWLSIYSVSLLTSQSRVQEFCRVETKLHTPENGSKRCSDHTLYLCSRLFRRNGCLFFCPFQMWKQAVLLKRMQTIIAHFKKLHWRTWLATVHFTVYSTSTLELFSLHFEKETSSIGTERNSLA